jgi:YidC/Oxa1 family membrane protein insertase
MNLFDLILVQPIFNLLLFIYGIIPGHDFGVALILFTIVVRLIMWPLVRRQLHQTRVMQSLQGELKKIKQRTKGNKQLESQLMMELYRERGVNPFGSIGLLLVQLPVFISLYAVVRLITANHGANIAKYAYGFVEQIPYIKDIMAHPEHLNSMLFGLVDLTRTAFSSKGFYVPIFILAVLAAMFQFWQSKQVLPKVKEGRRLRDVLKEQAKGKEVDQSELSALMSNRMTFLFPILTFMISIYLAGALVLYLATTSLVAVIQQALVLRGDSEELIQEASQPPAVAEKLQNAQEAVVIEAPKSPVRKQKKKGKKR